MFSAGMCIYVTALLRHCSAPSLLCSVIMLVPNRKKTRQSRKCFVTLEVVSPFFTCFPLDEGSGKHGACCRPSRMVSHYPPVIGAVMARIFQHNATSWDNGCQKPPLLTPFLHPVAPRRARDRVPSILALGLFFTKSAKIANLSPLCQRQ